MCGAGGEGHRAPRTPAVVPVVPAYPPVARCTSSLYGCSRLCTAEAVCAAARWAKRAGLIDGGLAYGRAEATDANADLETWGCEAIGSGGCGVSFLGWRRWAPKAVTPKAIVAAWRFASGPMPHNSTEPPTERLGSRPIAESFGSEARPALSDRVPIARLGCAVGRGDRADLGRDRAELGCARSVGIPNANFAEGDGGGCTTVPGGAGDTGGRRARYGTVPKRSQSGFVRACERRPTQSAHGRTALTPRRSTYVSTGGRSPSWMASVPLSMSTMMITTSAPTIGPRRPPCG